MKYILLILLLAFLAFRLLKKSHEHFEVNDNETEEPSVEDVLSSLDINLDDYIDKQGEIDFADLPLDILDESSMDLILKAVDKEFTRPDYSVDRGRGRRKGF